MPWNCSWNSPVLRSRWPFVWYTLIAAQLFSVVGWNPSARGDDSQLNVVFAIDVSGSMYSQAGRRWNGTPPIPTDRLGERPVNGDYPVNGSDPNRIRWDAAELAINMLTNDDRVAVVRFNSTCPARLPDNCNFSFAEFPNEMKPVQEIRGTLIKTLRDHNRDDDADNFNEFNIKHVLDIGGTNIRAALETSISRLRSTSGGRRIVILLTDGMDELINTAVETDPVRYRKEMRQWLSECANLEIKVHVLGLNLAALGENQPAARESLLEIARETKGSYQDVKDAKDIVCVFRNLIRDLKQYWSQSAAVTEGEISVPVVRGVRDVGVLLHRPVAHPKYPTKFPFIAPEILGGGKENWANWNAGTTPPPVVDRRVGWGWKLPGTNGLLTYLSVGELSDGNGSAFQKLNGVARVTWRVDKSQPPVESTVFKRMVKEPFELKLAGGRKLQRWDTVPVVVVMHPNNVAGLKPGDFEIVAYWRPKREASHDPCQVPDETSGHAVVLQAATDEAANGQSIEYRGEFRLDSITPSGIGEFELVVAIQARPISPVLAGFRRQFPPMTFEVFGDAALELTPRIVRSSDDTAVEKLAFRDNETLVVNLEPKIAGQSVESPLEVEFEIIPPKNGEEMALGLPFFISEPRLLEESPKGRLSLSSRPKVSSLSQMMLTFTDQPKNLDRLSRPKAFQGGKLIVRSPKGTAEPGNARPGNVNRRISELTIDLNVTLLTIPLEIEGVIGGLDNRKRGESEKLRVVRSVPGARKVGPIEVRLVPETAPEPAFSDQELWLERVGKNADEPRSQTLTDVGLDSEFKVHFLTRRKVKSSSRYELRVISEGEVTATQSFELAIDPWTIQAGTTAFVLEGSPGQRISTEISVHLLDQEGQVVPVWIPRPPASTWIRPAGGTPPEFVNLPGETNPVMVSGPKGGMKREILVKIELQIPPKCVCGSYKSKLLLTGEQIAGVEIPVTVMVDQLELGILNADGRIRPWSDTDSPLVRQKTRAELDLDLQVQLQSGREFIFGADATSPFDAPHSEGGHRQPVPIGTPKPNGRTATLTVTMPAVIAMDSADYTCKLTVSVPYAKESQNAGSHRLERELRIRYLDSSRFVSPRKEPK